MLLYVIDKGWFNAASPDAPVFVLTLLIAWLMLLAPRGANSLALLLALAAFSFKLSALPLLPVAAWYARWPRCRRALWVAVPLGAMLVAQSFISNGCLAYPLAQSCFAVDWGVGAAAATRDASAVLQWARWSGAPAATVALTGWLPAWASAHDVEIALFALALLALVWRHRRISGVAGAGSVASFAMFSIAFGMISAPDVRFWGGSLFALLGLAGLLFWPARLSPLPAAGSAHKPWFTLVAASALIVIIVVGGARKPLAVLWLPPALQLPALTLTSTAGGLAYWLPTSGDQCWSAPLPCAPVRLATDIRYRDATAGISAGLGR
jgi:hypothetical protein